MDKTEITVLVTGVGAIIGQGIIKSLRSSKYSVRIIGIDRSNRSPGPFMCDVFHQKPHYEENSLDYIKFWINIINKEKIDIIMPGLEVDVFFLDKQRQIFQELGTIVVINQTRLITLSSDKWELSLQLKELAVPSIPSLIPESWQHATLILGKPPFLLKPRNGNASRGIVTIYDENDFIYWRSKSGDNWMLQKIVGDENNEFTVGIFGFGDGKSNTPIILRRRLSSAGNTLEAQVINDLAIREVTNKLTKFFKPLGPTNYQFRKEDHIAYLLEINPRFSSSNSLRTAFGFNEAEMSIEYFKYGKVPEEHLIKRGTAWRYSADFIKYDSNSL